jgi:DnaJ-class molecular chaperone
MKTILLLLIIFFFTILLANDHYNTLGINKNANEKEIKKAYKKLALKFHPDRNKGNKEAQKKFIEISQAYEVLKDPKTKLE